MLANGITTYLIPDVLTPLALRTALIVSVWMLPVRLTAMVLPARSAGLVIFDAGVQGTHISNQTIVYALRPDARSRLNSAYMTAYFLGGAAGSGLSAVAYATYGWPGVSLLAAAFPAVGFCVWLVDTARRRLSRSG